MGGCLTTQQQNEPAIPSKEMSSQGEVGNVSGHPETAGDEARAEAAQAEPSTTDAQSAVSVEAPNAMAKPSAETSLDSLGDVGSPKFQATRSGSPNPNAVLTESALRQLNQTSSLGKKGRPSSTGDL